MPARTIDVDTNTRTETFVHQRCQRTGATTVTIAVANVAVAARPLTLGARFTGSRSARRPTRRPSVAGCPAWRATTRSSTP